MNHRGGNGWIVGLTGASGAVYGVTLVRELLQRGITVHLLITEAGWRVLKDELDWPVHQRKQCIETYFGGYEGKCIHYPIQDIGASIASGSYLAEGMVIVPCSMGTLASVANGMSNNLLQRSADVMLKERRKLIMVPRETPLHSIHLENMLKCTRAGAMLLPAMPAFYHRPQTIDELVRFLTGKILDAMSIQNDTFPRWGDLNGV